MTADAETRGPAARALTALRGGTTPALPARVHEDVARQQDRSEQIISVVQIVIVVLFGGLFLLAPDGGNTELAFELTPWVLGGYLVFSVLRFWASCRTRLPGWFLPLSVIADMFLLMVLIWSFHRTYQQPPPFYLKAPTLLYVFIFIALRALRFDARYVQLAGVTAIVGLPSRSSLARSTGVPSPRGSVNRISPPAMEPMFGRIPMIAWLHTDLPEPDSPTRAVVPPWRMRKDTPSTARSWSPWTVKSTLRSRTLRRSVIAASPPDCPIR
jgi:hypothetical protein